MTSRIFAYLLTETSLRVGSRILFSALPTTYTHHREVFCVDLAYSTLVNVMMMYFEMSLRPRKLKCCASCFVQLFYIKEKTVVQPVFENELILILQLLKKKRTLGLEPSSLYNTRVLVRERGLHI